VDSNDPDDPGGQTRYGITAGEWMTRWCGHPPKPLSQITIEDARAFYKRWYWDEPGLGGWPSRHRWSPGVLRGGGELRTGTAVLFLQRALNFLAGAGLLEDGGCGPKTGAAVRAFVARGREYQSLLVLAQNGEQYIGYKACVDARPLSRKYAPGWMKRVEDDHA